MIKKILLVIVICFIMINVVNGKEKKTIPEEAIRLRVVANSDSEYDQEIKMKVKEKIQKELSLLLSDVNDIMETRLVIANNFTRLDNLVNDVLKEEDYKLGYKINYGYNYFPEKEYNGEIYEEGEYESLLITLGEGNGSNWWCVLFPPLCIIEAEEDTEEVRYESFFSNFIKNLFDK